MNSLTIFDRVIKEAYSPGIVSAVAMRAQDSFFGVDKDTDIKDLKGISAWIPSNEELGRLFQGIDRKVERITYADEPIKFEVGHTIVPSMEPDPSSSGPAKCSRCSEPFPYEAHESGKCYRCRS